VEAGNYRRRDKAQLPHRHGRHAYPYCRRAAVRIRGAKAIADAAQKASDFERRGDHEARTWRRIEAALLVMRGPGDS
jgi:hypothetical protein